MIFTYNLLPEEHRQVWDHARAHADEVYQTETAYPTVTKAVHSQDPQWDCNTPGYISIQTIDQFMGPLLARSL